MNKSQLQKTVFGKVFKLSNRLQNYLDHKLSDDELTAKQLYLLIAVGNTKEPPSFRETSDISGSSYQNVKQLALKLEKKGYLKIEDDSIDMRTKRIVTTDKTEKYWKTRNDKDREALENLFHDFSEEELISFINAMNKLERNIEND